MAKKQVSAGAVLFRNSRNGARFLLIRNAKGHWDFPKGRLETGETPLQACRREVREESGISRFNLVPGFREKRTWSFQEGGKQVVKDCWFFLGRVSGVRIRLSPEHTRGGWLTAGAALRRLKYPGQRSLIRVAARKLMGAGS